MSANLDQDILQFWSLLFHILTDIEERIAAHIATQALSPPQFYVLKTLFEHGGECAIGKIASEHHLTNATMTGLVKRLEQHDPPLVMRSRNAHDRRSIMVTLTEAGRERYNAVSLQIMAQVRDMMALLDDDGRDKMIEYASYYISNVVPRFPVDEINRHP